jgi:outer membrane protein assembly factor BamB
MTWGHSGSPLIVEGKLIVQPGGPHASLVALDPDTGETIWTSSGGAASYSSFMPVELGNQLQIIGYDFESLGAWDIKTGKRLWKHVPARAGDFNVPTVLIQSLDPQTRLIVSSENNGTRMMGFNPDGSLQTKQLAQYRQLAPDTHTPVLAGDWVVGVSNYLYAINTDDHFQTVLELEDAAFEQYCSLVGTDNRLLAMNMDGELLLIELTDQELRIVSRWKLDAEPASVYSHPAVADIGVYVRLGKKLVKLELLSTQSREK